MNLHTSNPTDSPIDITCLDSTPIIEGYAPRPAQMPSPTPTLGCVPMPGPQPVQKAFAARMPDASVLQTPPMPSASIRRSVLEEAIKVVCGERETTYGGPEDSFSIIGTFWECYIKAKYKSNPTLLVAELFIEPVDVALMMSLLKTARLATTGGKHRDSLVDGAGYFACAAECSLK